MKINKIFSKAQKSINDFLGRRPHRSFNLTRRRDYNRSLKLPGYFAFTKYVRKIIWENRKAFGLLALIYAVMIIILVGIMPQTSYQSLSETLNTTSKNVFVGGWGEIGKAGLLYVTAITGRMTQSLTEVQQVFAGIIAIFAWLTSVWMLRNILAGHKVKVRDGLYNAGAPILSTFMVAILIIFQLLPMALAVIGYVAADTTGLLANGIEAMLFWLSAGLLSLLSLYWITSTIFALIIVTLPGMYPYRAIKAASDLVVGRRLRILLRFLWLIVTIVISWAIIMIPMILFDSWIKGVWSAIEWIPIVPIVLLVLTSITVIWISSYIYLLYRKVVADGANPTV